jgi:leucyl-tRNA synthetase
MSKAKYTVTAALPYANGPLHLGHVAGVYLPADIFVRFLRMNNHDVAFICGSDEHGAAITLRAKKEGISPQEIVDKYNEQIGKSFRDFDISLFIKRPFVTSFVRVVFVCSLSHGRFAQYPCIHTYIHRYICVNMHMYI